MPIVNTNGHTTHDPLAALVANTFLAAPFPLPVSAPPSPPRQHFRADPLERMVANFFMTRSSAVRRLSDPRRDVGAECGHPETYSARQYQDLYDRNGLAARVVEVCAKAAWSVTPRVYEDEDTKVVTPFERDWDALGSMLSGGSKLKQEEGSPVYDLLRQADVECGIGSYGGILLGLDDVREGGPTLRDPAFPRKGAKLLFARSVPEAYAQINRWETSRSSPRFGQPLEYLVTFGDPTQQEARSDWFGGPGLTTETVHWTRFVHLCDQGVVAARPRLQQVLPYILDATKILGADAEAAWQQLVAGMIFATDPTLAGNVEVDASGLKDEYEKFVHGLQRALVVNGFTPSRPTPNLADPTPHLMAQLQAISIRTNVPLRVLMGSEQGRLAADQDSKKWATDIRSHRRMDVTPRKIAPFVDRLIMLGVLSEPAQYVVDWPDEEQYSPAEKSAVALQTTQSLAQYVGGNVEAVVGLQDYLTRVLGWSEEEAVATIDNVEGMLEELRGKEDDADVAKAETDAERMKQMATETGEGDSDAGFATEI